GGTTVASDDDGGNTSFVFTPTVKGDYAVSLTVTDKLGSSRTVTQSVTVLDEVPKAAIDSVSDPRGEGTAITAGGPASFIGVGTGHTLTRSWAVYQGANATAFATGGDVGSFTFTPGHFGDYRIVLTVADDTGLTATDSRTITVANVPP